MIVIKTRTISISRNILMFFVVIAAVYYNTTTTFRHSNFYTKKITL